MNKTTKLHRFTVELEYFIMTTDKNTIKKRIKDSTNNNRTPSVNQVIKFLLASNNSNYKRLGKNLANLRSIVDLSIARTSKKRSDAYDINEFISVLKIIDSCRALGISSQDLTKSKNINEALKNG